ADLPQRYLLLLGNGDIELVRREAYRHEQRLHGYLSPIETVLQLFVGDAFVRRVHVHDDEPGPVLSEYVDTGKLRKRIAQWDIAVRRRWLRRSERLSRSDMAEQLFVKGRGLGEAQRHAALGNCHRVGVRQRCDRDRLLGAGGTGYRTSERLMQ